MEVLARVNYERRAEIGSLGRNSRVFRAYDNHLGTELAVKEIQKSSIPDPRRFFDEARAFHAAAHPRVVPIQWAAETDESICLALPLMAGGSLTDRIVEVPLRVREVIRIAQDICCGVAQAHLAGLLHLDLKPTNVLFDAHNRAAITDFGQALSFDRATGTADVAVHPMYLPFMPPEVADTGVVTQAADVYQIGLTLYRALWGEPAYRQQLSGLDRATLEELVASGDFPHRGFLPHVPSSVASVITKAMSVDPARRQQSATEVAEALSRIVVAKDWMVERHLPDDTEWRLAEPNRAPVVIRRVGAHPASIEIWTDGAAGRRKKCSAAWAKVHTERDLRAALRRAFREAVA